MDALISYEFAWGRNLNPRWTFENFVIGDCNSFAHAVAKSVAENPGGPYNPLFICSRVGLGKTHLMNAIGWQALSRNNNIKIAFLSSEEFANELIHAIRFDTIAAFRNKYKSMDLLLIDAVHFVAGKSRTQEELDLILDYLYEKQKQIVVNADCRPDEMRDMDARLKSLFARGLLIELGVPDLETRVAIVKSKACEENIDMPADVAHYLAEQIDCNVTCIVGCLLRVVAMSEQRDKPITVELAEESLDGICPPRLGKQ